MGVRILLKLVFTSDGVTCIVGVVIRSVERWSQKQNADSAYNSQCRLQSSENCIVGVQAEAEEKTDDTV